MNNPGIYKFTCNVNGKCYIGSSYNIIKRKNDHLSQLRTQKHPNIHFQRSFNKYGEEAFLWEVLEYCELDKLIEREQYYLDTYKPELNINPTAHSSLGVRRSDETKKKISEAKKGIYAGEKHHNFGKHHPQEIRDKMSKGRKDKQSPMKGKKHTQEALQKISDKLKGRISNRKGEFKYTGFIKLDKNTGEELGTYYSSIDAANSVGRFETPDSTKIIRACKETYRTAFGYKWKFKVDG